MNGQDISVSFVITTLGRTDKLDRLLKSLSLQLHTNFDVLIVDQNADDRLEFIFRQEWPFQLSWLRTPGLLGASRGRNTGWRTVAGTVVVFPDDDCWYPKEFLSRGLQIMDNLGADVLAGRAADENGHDINGRFSKAKHAIDRSNVWISGIEWAMFFKKTALLAVDGYDEDIGIGASTPWQSCEAQDIMLRAIVAGLKCFFDPTVYGHHEELNVLSPDTPMIKKGRAYARGFGHVLRVHNYGKVAAGAWIVRPLIRLIVSLFKGNLKRSTYLYNVFVGRTEGYVGRTW